MFRFVFDWLVGRWNWPYAAAMAGVFLLLLIPLQIRPGDPHSVALALILLQLPMYMLHQLEEHAGDRFRKFVNRNAGGGFDVLSRRATFWINSVGVWGVDLLACYLAAFVDLSLGLLAIWLTVINAFVHIVQGILMWQYNPGLVSAWVAFLPVGLFSLVEVSRVSQAGAGAQILGLGAAVLFHAGIALHVKRQIFIQRSRAGQG